jgi:hypothetical protein
MCAQEIVGATAHDAFIEQGITTKYLSLYVPRLIFLFFLVIALCLQVDSVLVTRHNQSVK